METTIAYLERNVERERARSDFLESAVRNYAPHILEDIQPILDRDYPRAIPVTKNDDD